MRWTFSIPRRPKPNRQFICDYPRNGSKQIIAGFAFFPVRVGNDYRWLERYEVEQEYVYYASVDHLDPFRRIHGWNNIRFIDKEN